MNPVEFDTGLFRGPRPTSRQDIWKLKMLGVSVILDLQSEFWELEETQMEKQWTSSFKITSFHLPMSVFFPPKAALIRDAVTFLGFHRGRKKSVYVHCSNGQDRTGVVVAAYQATLMGKPYNVALGDMISQGYRLWQYWWWLPALKCFVRRCRQR